MVKRIFNKNRGEGSKLRIISGKYKGKFIEFFPNTRDLNIIRPTKNFARENLFNSINFRLNWSKTRVLDLFAGSGSLGIESLSRGAKYVHFLDVDKFNIECILSNIKRFNESNDSYIAQRANSFDWLDSYNGKPFDLVFIDPPFTENLHEKIFSHLKFRHSIFKSGSLVFVEYPIKQEVLFLEGYKLIKEKISGSVRSLLFEIE